MILKIIVTIIILSTVFNQVSKAEEKKYFKGAFFDLFIMCIYLTTVIGIYLFLK
jgi:hypothetical protein|nr:MAG TPA: hypothetical protein [Caudoviricetes sp.]